VRKNTAASRGSTDWTGLFAEKAYWRPVAGPRTTMLDNCTYRIVVDVGGRRIPLAIGGEFGSGGVLDAARF
jgi:hypothetical protein